ncbi:MAG: bifunctional nuclease family protein, partial [bacterium]|nr:bifunctional nuclease family protein [bacterium]
MVPVEILGVSRDGQYQPVVILRHEDRVLLILVGPSEAEAIHLALIEKDLGRPMTHDLICNLLAGLRGELQSVNIYKLENDTFYAYLNIEQKNPAGEVEQVLRV